eukprot:m.176890 g.176890  ORF g.176890 m.176890 type:complete len:219 (+) comp24467_c0_seq1:255-911(+)
MDPTPKVVDGRARVAPVGGARHKHVARRPAQTAEGIVRDASMVIEAVTFCLQNGVGARVAVKQKNLDGSPRWPALKVTNVHRRLTNVKKSKLPPPPDGWTPETVGPLAYPQGLYESLRLLTAREESDLASLVTARSILKNPMDRVAQRGWIKMTLQQRYYRLHDKKKRYKVSSLSSAAWEIVQARGAPTAPSDHWFLDFYRRHPSKVEELDESDLLKN